MTALCEAALVLAPAPGCLAGDSNSSSSQGHRLVTGSLWLQHPCTLAEEDP